jgi:hypothetical protein
MEITNYSPVISGNNITHPFLHSWASAFRHPVSQYGTGLVPALAFLFTRYWTDRMPDSPTFRHLQKWFTLHIHTAGGGKEYTLHVYCWLWKWIHPARKE